MRKIFKVGDEVVFDMREVSEMDLEITDNRKFTVMAVDNDLLTLDVPAAYNSSKKGVKVIHKDYFILTKSSSLLSTLKKFYEEHYKE